MLLNPSLSPRARLLYAVLAAKMPSSSRHDCLETELMTDVPELVGVATSHALAPLMDELLDYGIVSQFIHRGAARPSVRVHVKALSLGDPGRSCRPCIMCSRCACEEHFRLPFPVEVRCGPCESQERTT
ncbi:hypothetical protein [Kitasatospora aureofaciens]|uniref:hypothetical protein n=1 Tax=Kitasatospora aureofaciens TaxID=1894 RepID=UPI0005258608|nr:hypothetical protein [Kitasatospora aureofaciens]